MSTESDSKRKTMIVAIPIADGCLAMHFGHCQEFALIEVDADSKEIVGERRETPPPHEPGVLPAWLAELGANMIIAGGMGSRAQALFTQNAIQVVTGAPALSPAEIVTAYLAGKLEMGNNLCDH